MGKLHTCYAPVRRSPSNKASFVHAAPRLACVKPIASVHPEPGSNSSLYIYFFIRLSLNSSFIVVKNRRWYFFTLYLYYIFVVSDFQRIAVFSFSGYLSRLRMQSYDIFRNYQNICNKKIQYFFFQTSALLTRRQPLSIADAKLLLFPKLPKYF